MDVAIAKKYEFQKRLGKGAYGVVWKAVSKRSRRTVAVKKIFDAFRNGTDAQRTFREIVFLWEFNDHPNVIKLLNVHRADNDRDIYLVFEFMNTDLHHVIRKGNILRTIHVKFIMYQLFSATQYLHSGDLIHRDLKPSNVLLDSECNCKIADFGLARSLANHRNRHVDDGSQENVSEGMGDHAHHGNDVCLTDYVATRWYRAPEILQGNQQYTKGVDLWSLGCILGEAMLGVPLFPGKSTLDQRQRIEHFFTHPDSLGGHEGGIGDDKDARHLVRCLLDRRPEDRLTANDSMRHPFVSQFYCSRDQMRKGGAVLPPFDDNVQLTVDEYREKLYDIIAEQKRRYLANRKK